MSTIDLLAATGTDMYDSVAACPVVFGLLKAGSDVQILFMVGQERTSLTGVR